MLRFVTVKGEKRVNRQQKIRQEMENKILNAKIQKYVMAERQTIFVETILILMFVLKK